VQTLSEIKAALELRGLRPNRALGQNFLCDHNLIQRLIDASGVGAGDLVLEVGPGTGTLTESLLGRGCTIVACELDRGLADLLGETLAGHIESKHLTLIRGDCLANRQSLNPRIAEALTGRPFTLVANLPYGAASPLMVILAGTPACRGQYVTIQREVAQRLRAAPSTRDYSELSVVVQAMCRVERIATLAPECFWPRPKVTSEMVAIVPRAEPLTDDPRALAALCHRLFTQRRKQIGSILGRDAALPEGVEPTMRPENLTPRQLAEMAKRKMAK
jgi:16S rRNA (adenine1518-N6/adenine1519-N6)-dimethyltransferase